MQWTTDRPTRSGWYWFRPGDNTPDRLSDHFRDLESAIGTPTIVHVNREVEVVETAAKELAVNAQGIWLVKSMGGMFAGPIEPPRE